MCPQEALKPVLFKEDLAKALLDGRKIEVGFCDDQPELLGLQIEALLPEQVVPHRLLVIPVDQVALLEGQHVEEGGEITTVLDLIAHKGSPLL
jgi:hypothetical protein